MFKKTPQVRVLFNCWRRQAQFMMLGVIFIALIATSVATVVQPQRAVAASNNNLNFQARLQTASGAVVPDGEYNIQFKLYDDDTSGSLLWSESWYDSNGATAGNDNRLLVKNGYFSANLGGQTAFPTTIDWDQDLWLTMRVGGSAQTSSPSYDTEMDPRLKLTGVPYAFRAGELAKRNNATGYTGLLQFQNTTGGNQTFIIPDQGAAGTYTLMTEESLAGAAIQNGTGVQSNSNIAIQSAADSSVTALLKARSGQSADILQLTDSSNAVLMNVTSAGNVGITNNASISGLVGVGVAATSGEQLRVQTSSASVVGLSIVGSASQTADLLKIDGNGTRALNYSSNGGLYITAGSGQSANLLTLEDSGSNVIARFTAAGSLQTSALDTVTAGTLDIGATNATTINVGSSSVALHAPGGVSLDTGKPLNFETGTNDVQISYSSGANSLNVGNGNTSGLVRIQGDGFQVQDTTSFNVNLSMDNTGATLFKNRVNSTTALQIQPSGSTTPVFNADTTNSRVGINKNNPGYALDVAGDINTSGVYRAAGTSGATTTCSGGQLLQNAVVAGGIVTGGSCVAADGGVTTVGTIDSQTKSANGLVIAGTSIYMQTADATSPGLMSTGTQTLAGSKTWTGTATLFKPGTNSTTAFQIQPASSSTSVFNVNTTNSRVGINTNSPGYTLDVAGDLNLSTGSQFRINGVDICDNAGCAPASNSTNYIQNWTSSKIVAQDANIWVTSNDTSTVTARFQQKFGQSADILQAANGVGSVNFSIDSHGYATFKATDTSSSAATFQVQDTGGTSLFYIENSNKRIYVGNPTADSTGALLVLDTKNNSGDPTGVNGAMYYNSNSGRFRCYESSAWQNCLSRNDYTPAFIGYNQDPNSAVGVNSTAAGTGTANYANLVSVTVPVPTTVSGIRVSLAAYSGTAGNVDVGLYNNSGTRLASSGSVAAPTSNTVSTVNFTSSASIQPGIYWLAIASNQVGKSDGTGGPIFKRYGLDGVGGNLAFASSFPLPSSVTLGSPSGAGIPFALMGIVSGGVTQ